MPMLMEQTEQSIVTERDRPFVVLAHRLSMDSTLKPVVIIYGMNNSTGVLGHARTER